MFGAKKLLASVTLAIAFAGSALAFPTPNTVRRADGSVLKSAPSVIPQIWQEVGNAIDTDAFEFTMALSSADMDGLTERMNQIAATNGQWLTDDELAQYARPSDETTNVVRSYLKAQGIADDAITASKFGDQLTVKTTVAQTAKLFAAQFQKFNVNGVTTARTKSFTIPQEIAAAVSDVYPLVNFGSVRHMTSVIEDDHFNSTVAERAFQESVEILESRATPSSCSTSAVTPQCLKDYYGRASYSPSTGSSRPDVGVMGYIDQYVSVCILASHPSFPRLLFSNLFAWPPAKRPHQLPQVILVKRRIVQDSHCPS